MIASRTSVIVAGAGPAGAVAARALASAGLDTVLVDKSAFPRNKPCGGGISVRALGRFPWLADAMRDIDVHRIRRVHLEGPGGASLDLESGDPILLLIRRIEFDAALVRAAVAAGARLETGFEIAQVSEDAGGVTLHARNGRRLSARAVIAADGVHSVIAKRLGVNARWPRASLALDMMEETPDDRLRANRPDVLWVGYGHDGLDGYAYVFPKTKHTNVGIGCLLSQFDTTVNDAPYALQERFVSSLVAAGVLHGGSARESFTPFLIPVGGPLPRAGHGRVLFAGDAGGFVNPLTAEGIYYAMASGELAARAVIATKPSIGEAAGHAYERLWRGEIGRELFDAVLVQRYLFGNHDRIRHVVQGAAILPGLTDLILDYAIGRLSYTALRRRMMLRFPATMVRLAREKFGT